MTLLTDLEIHQHPDFAAAILHWIAEGHAERRVAEVGILVPWAILGLGLVGTEDIHQLLPARRVKFASWMGDEKTRAWRGFSRDIILAWRDPFWSALARGVESGVISYHGGRISKEGRLHDLRDDPYPARMSSMSRRIGAMIGDEQDDARIASGFGVDIVP